MTTETLRHLGNDAADNLVLYLQDDSPSEAERNHKIGCNLRCHAFDAGVVAGRMNQILDEERDRVLTLLVGQVRSSTLEHIVQTVLAHDEAHGRTCNAFEHAREALGAREARRA